MKAAIVRAAGQTPVFGDFDEPHASAGESLVSVTAAAVSHIVKNRASGAHYSSSAQFPFVIGIDGVGRLDDGRRVYFILPRAPHGSMAERTVVASMRCIPVPEDVDDVTGAAIANPGMSSWAAFTERAKLKPGETVLVNGAGGTSGRLAVQIAKHLGAARVIATARSAPDLQSVAALGADVTIRLGEDEAAVEAALGEQFGAGVDVVLDYLWGWSAERILSAVTRAGKHDVPLRFVQIGHVSGAEIRLPASTLRSAPVQLMGSGIGSVPVERFVHVIGELFRATVPAGLRVAVTPVPLSQVESAWPNDDSTRRTVFTVGLAGS